MGDLHSLPDFRRQKEHRDRMRFLDAEEEGRLFSAIRHRSEHYYSLSVFLVDTGARLGEAINLRWTDVHDGSALFSVTKSEKNRSISLTKRAADAIFPVDQSRLGPFSDVEQSQYHDVWHQAKADIGLTDDDLVPGCLRHTCASRLVRGGVFAACSGWLGHQTLKTTMRYAHLATSELDVCLPILERR